VYGVSDNAPVQVSYFFENSLAARAGAATYNGISLDQTSNVNLAYVYLQNPSATALTFANTMVGQCNPSQGQHFITAIEISDGNTTAPNTFNAAAGQFQVTVWA
jgi:hypothetical protein